MNLLLRCSSFCSVRDLYPLTNWLRKFRIEPYDQLSDILNDGATEITNSSWFLNQIPSLSVYSLPSSSFWVVSTFMRL